MRPDPHSPSNDRVREATGRSWNAWFSLLDEAGGATMSHRDIVAWIATAGGANAWWRQTVAVAYEKARGLRSVVGETADAGFQVGVRRTVAVAADVAWRYLVEGAGRDAWLGPTTSFTCAVGSRFHCDDGTTGDIRSVAPGRRLRLTWRPPAWERPSTLQLTVVPKGERCVLAIHHERLPDPATRAAMKERWTAFAEGLRDALVADPAAFGETGVG